MNSHTEKEETILEAIELIKKTKSIEYSKAKASQIMEESWKDINKLLPDGQSKAYLREFAEFIIKREL